VGVGQGGWYNGGMAMPVAPSHPRTAVPLPLDEIGEFCRRWKLVELSVFGSILRDDFRPDSDVDVLVRFEPAARPSLLTLGQMKKELSELFGRDVDLLEEGGVREMTNPYFRQEILRTSEVVYAR
jgi:uncharacterized protein